MPRVHVRLFGPARDTTGQASITLDLPTGATIAGLAAEMAKRFPMLGPVRIAVNRAYAADCQLLNEADEVAIIPPVSGG